MISTLIEDISVYRVRFRMELGIVLVEQNDDYRFFSQIHELTSSGMLTQFLVVDVVSLLLSRL